MLDLTLQKELYKIKWVDGEVLKLNPPTQRVYTKILNMQQQKDNEEILNSVYATTKEIINNNTSGKVVDNITDLSLDTCLLVVQDYFDFYTKQINENVVFPQTQQTSTF